MRIQDRRGIISCTIRCLLALLLFDPVLTGAQVLWDPIDSHEWIGEPWESGITIDHIDVDSRRCLRGLVTSSTGYWALLRTKRFPLENWEAPVAALRGDVYLTGADGGTLLKLEVHGPSYDPKIGEIGSGALSQGVWQSVTWVFPAGLDLAEVGAVSLVLDQIHGRSPTVLIDNLRLVMGDGSESEWDAMDGAFQWFHGGNWFNWSGVTNFPGIEPISAGGSLESPTASLFLEWDAERGVDPSATTAELGTHGSNGSLELDFDLSLVTRIGMQVNASTADVPFSIFFYDIDSGSGFATPSVFLTAANTWEFVSWDIPWPGTFDRVDVDEIKLVVGDINTTSNGWARFDHIVLFTNSGPSAVSGRPTVINDFESQDVVHNQIGGAYGELTGGDVSPGVALSFDTGAGRAGSQAAQKLEFWGLTNGFCGIWNSLRGRADYPEFVMDVRPYDYLRFFVRSAHATNATYNLKVEVKDSGNGDDPFFHTAYTYVPVDGNSTEWREVILDLDLADRSLWSHNRFAPDPGAIKELVFVLENHFNPETGVLLIDDIEFTDADLAPVAISPTASDAEFLAYALDVNLNYFLVAVHPDTGLVLDRLSSSDLASVAATGFGLAAWSVAAEIGKISRDEAFARAEKAMVTLATAPMGFTAGPGARPTEEGQIGVNGFFYHFLGSRTGTRATTHDEGGWFVDGSELSPVDTALCAFGVLACQAAMKAANGYTATQEVAIASLGETILSRIDWPFLLTEQEGQQRIFLAWKPEQHGAPNPYEVPHPSGFGFVANEGMHVWTWDYYTDEVLLMALIGLGAPDPAKRLPLTVMSGFDRETGSFRGRRLVQSFPGAAFTYEFANLWLRLVDLPPDVGGTDYWVNSYRALRANYEFCTHPSVQGAFDSFDGVSAFATACEDPSRRYSGFGAPPAGAAAGLSDDAAIALFFQDDPKWPNLANGVIAPYGAAAAIDFLPDEAIAALRHYYFDLGICNELFGFADAFHKNIGQFLAAESELATDPKYADIHEALTRFSGAWANHNQFGIDQGPIVLALANALYGGAVQAWVASSPHMQAALAQAFPTNTVFRPELSRLGGTEFELSWTAAGAGRRYGPEFSETLLPGSWLLVDPRSDWPAARRAVDLTVDAGARHMFFRAVASEDGSEE